MADDPTPPPAPAGRVEPTFSNEFREVLSHYKSEAAGYKSRVSAVERERDEARAAIEAERAKVTEAVAAAEAKAHARLVRAELKAAAVKAGIKDPRDLALFDTSKVKLDDNGDLADADALIEAFRKDKPHLFGPSGNSSSTATPPPAAGAAPKRVQDMTPDERAAEARRLGIKLRA